jgi:hypothetical protein
MGMGMGMQTHWKWIDGLKRDVGRIDLQGKKGSSPGHHLLNGRHGEPPTPHLARPDHT